eukprot:2697685-Pyramimonas_sp.AAC.1
MSRAKACLRAAVAPSCPPEKRIHRQNVIFTWELQLCTQLELPTKFPLSAMYLHAAGFKNSDENSGKSLVGCGIPLVENSGVEIAGRADV